MLCGAPFLVSLTVLLLNDRWWKGAWPGFVTGKLSDVAGVVVAAVLVSVAVVAVGVGERRAAIGSAAYFGFLFLFHVVSPGGLGFGDVRLALVLGLYLGWIDLRLPLFGLLLGNLVYLGYAVPARITGGKGGAKHSPFGPGLAMGTLLAVVFSSSLI